MRESTELRHRSLQARCFHPDGGWTAFGHAETDQSLPDRFAKMVSRHPDQLAVKSPEAELSYRELDNSANCLAHALIERLGHAAEPVGVMVQHGVRAVVATMAVLKAGKFYVPLDPRYPKDRLAYMLEDTGAALILTDPRNRQSAEELSVGRVPILSMDDRPASLSAGRPALPIAPDSLAGIYYTSGSTGRPKGIAYTHRYLLHNMMNYGNAFHVCPHDRWTWLHSYSFATTLTDILCPLLHGAAVCAWDVQRDGMAELRQWLAGAGVTICNWMPTPFRTFATNLEKSRGITELRLMVFGGEKLFTRDFTAFREFFSPRCIFVNRLGASETGVFRLYFFDRDTPIDDPVVPAGYAVPEKTVVLLDENDAECPPGAVGEIGVRSRYFPVGYWRQPEATREKYRADADGGAERTYLTGDLGRLRPDGCLEYHGRKDMQVKVRGHRIETGEIESALRDLSGVREAVVKACEDTSGDTYLAAYFVPSPSAPVDANSLRKHLLGKLPAYMMPAVFVPLVALPRSPNQKIDLAALPAPNVVPALHSDRYAPPHTPLQCRLVELWQQVLEVQPIGIDDDFFELGGDSFRGMRMVAMLQPLLDSSLRVPPLFANPTVASYAEFLEAHYGRELARHMSPGIAAGEESTAGPGPAKLQRVRDEVAALPVTRGPVTPRERKRPPRCS
jgi:amino acid adenylation domain-containing protein